MLSMVTEGSVAELGKRNHISVGILTRDDVALVQPRDSVPFAALARAADEIARELTARLLLRFREARR